MKTTKVESKSRFALPHGLRGIAILPNEVYEHPDVIAAIITIQRGYRAAMKNRYSNLLKNLK